LRLESARRPVAHDGAPTTSTANESRDHLTDHGELLEVLLAEIDATGPVTINSFATTLATPSK